MLTTTWTAAAAVDWFVIADFARDKACYERQSSGRCNCISGRKGRKYNPCDRAMGIEQDAIALGCGDEPSGNWSMAAIIEWIEWHGTCADARAGRTCSHRGCDRTAHLLNWLYARAKAAA